MTFLSSPQSPPTAIDFGSHRCSFITVKWYPNDSFALFFTQNWGWTMPRAFNRLTLGNQFLSSLMSVWAASLRWLFYRLNPFLFCLMSFSSLILNVVLDLYFLLRRWKKSFLSGKSLPCPSQMLCFVSAENSWESLLANHVFSVHFVDFLWARLCSDFALKSFVEVEGV